MPPPPSFGAPMGGLQPSGVPGDLAGFGRRLGAYLLDTVLYGLFMGVFLVVGFVLIFGVGLADCGTDPFTDEIVCNGRENVGGILAGALAILVGFVLVLVVYLRSLARTGQTWGRKIVGVRVVASSTGGAPGWGRAIGRTVFAGFISGQVCYLGYLWMLWDGKNQTWHDKVAGTFVVRT